MSSLNLPHVTIIRPKNIHPLFLPNDKRQGAPCYAGHCMQCALCALYAPHSLKQVCQLHWEVDIYYCNQEANISNTKTKNETSPHVKHLLLSTLPLNNYKICNGDDDKRDRGWLHSLRERKGFQSLVCSLTDQPIGDHVMSDIKLNHIKLAIT